MDENENRINESVAAPTPEINAEPVMEEAPQEPTPSETPQSLPSLSTVPMFQKLTEMKKQLFQMKILLFLMPVLMIIILFISLAPMRKAAKKEPVYRVLTVCFTGEYYSDELSDSNQIYEAMTLGGDIYVASTSSYWKNVFRPSCDRAANYTTPDTLFLDYAATDEDGNYYIQGAELNFIAHFGWKLQTTIYDRYVFIREE